MGDKSYAQKNNKKFIEESGFFFSDPQIFTIFEYEWLVGSPSVLEEPNTTVLTEKIADKYFDNWKKATGQYLLLDNQVMVKISGIIKDPPVNTDFPFGIITSSHSAIQPFNYSTPKAFSPQHSTKMPYVCS